jgi:hypothetical protein
MDLQPGDLVTIVMPYAYPRDGRVDHVQRNGLVVVEMWSPRLRRYAYGRSTYHPKFVRPKGVA